MIGCRKKATNQISTEMSGYMFVVETHFLYIEAMISNTK